MAPRHRRSPGPRTIRDHLRIARMARSCNGASVGAVIQATGIVGSPKSAKLPYGHNHPKNPAVNNPYTSPSIMSFTVRPQP